MRAIRFDRAKVSVLQARGHFNAFQAETISAKAAVPVWPDASSNRGIFHFFCSELDTQRAFERYLQQKNVPFESVDIQSRR